MGLEVDEGNRGRKVTKTSMAKFLKEADSNGGVGKLLENPNELSKYLVYCTSLKKPRKLSSALKIILGDERSHGPIIEILELSLSKRDLKTIDRLVKLSGDMPDLTRRIDLIIMRDDIERKFRGNKPSQAQINRTRKLLSDKKAFESEVGKSVLTSLRLRLKKMYRLSHHDEIILLLDGTKIYDWNFQCCKFLLLSLRKRERDQYIGLLSGLYEDIIEPNNIEDLADMLYTENFHREVIQLCDRNSSNITFRTKLIYSRSLRKIGLGDEAENILSQAKVSLKAMIKDDDADISEVTKSILEIGFSGDIGSSENLLFDMTSRPSLSMEITENNQVADFVNLVRDTLDRQKRLRLSDALVMSKKLLETGGEDVAFRLLETYIGHGIGNSAELYDNYARAAIGSGNAYQLEEMIIKFSMTMNISTSERLIETLDSLNEYRLHSLLLDEMPNENLDSSKVIRSFFKVRLQYSGVFSAEEYFKRITSLKRGGKNISNFVEFLCRQQEPSKTIVPLLISSRIDEAEKLSSLLTLYQRKSDEQGARKTIQKILNIENINGSDEKIVALYEKSASSSFNYGDLVTTIDLVNRMEEMGISTRNLVSSKIRSLIASGSHAEAEEYMRENSGLLMKIQRLRFLLDIGKREEVRKEIEDINRFEVSLNEKKSIAEILFRLNMFEDYVEIYSSPIQNGEFNLTELTRYFHSLCKLSEEDRMAEEYAHLRRFHAWDPTSKAIIAIVGYDFMICEDYIEEIEMSIVMDVKNSEIPVMICNSFLAMDRIDIAFYFFSKYPSLVQKSMKGKEVSDRITGAIRDLKIKHDLISRYTIKKNPIYTDVEVIRNIMEKLPDKKGTIRKREKRLGIHSHTLDIGGAERQVSMLLRLLAKGKIKSKSFSFITNLVPENKTDSSNYYPEIEDLGIEIFEYGKNIEKYGEFRKNHQYIKILKHLSPLKMRRVLSMYSIYGIGKFDVVNTWQDWCNIYGGIASLMAGTRRVILFGRTMPPHQKNRLQSRSGRSYQEAYKLLLSSNRVEMVHNSVSGMRQYSEWLDIAESEFEVIHNGYEIDNFGIEGGELSTKRIELGISDDDFVVGFVGRFSSDKRPWLFISMAELIINGAEKSLNSIELEDWKRQNEENRVLLESKLGKKARAKIGKISGRTKFVMVCDGAQFEKAKSIIMSSENLRERVHLIGYSDEVSKFLEIFDCLVLTSKVEGLPNVIIEAQSFGIPVLTTDAGGARECILHGETGLVSESDTAEELAANLSEMLLNRDFMTGSGKRAKKFAMAEFGEKTWSKRMNDLFRRF